MSKAVGGKAGRLLARLTLALLLVIGFQGWGFRQTAGAATTCGTAEALKKAGQLDAAVAAYIEVVKADPTSMCAADGLKAIEAQQDQTACDTAKALADVGRIDSAAARYEEELKANPTSSCALAGIKAIDGMRNNQGLRSLDQLKFSGTNRLPTIFNPPTPFVLVFGLILLSAALVRILIRLFFHIELPSTTWVLVVVGLATTLVAVGMLKHDVGERELRCCVRVPGVALPPLPESSSRPVVAPVKVGSIQAANGDVGDVELSGDQLNITRVPRSGHYEGSADRLPDQAGGDVKIALDVRDWSLWALLTIILGALVGYAVVDYYKRRRPVERLELDWSALWKTVAEREAQFCADNANQLQTRYSIKPAVRSRFEESKLFARDQETLDKASKKLDEAQKYLDEFVDLAVSIGRTNRVRGKLRESIAMSPVPAENSAVTVLMEGLHPIEVRALSSADVVLEGHPFSPDDPDEIGRVKNDAEAVKEWLSLVDADITTILTHLGTMIQKLEQIGRKPGQPPWSDGDRTKLMAGIWQLGSDGRGLLRANKDDLGVAEKTATKTFEDFVALVRTVEKAGAVLPEPRRVAPIATLAFMDEGMTQWRITAVTETPQGQVAVDETARVNLDDELTFSVAMPELETAIQDVYWQVDGKQETEPASVSNKRPLTGLSSKFSAEGPHLVRVVDMIGREYAARTISVSQSREAIGRASLARDDIGLTLVTASLAVASGLLALYFAGTTWGAPGDYLKAFLWGSGLSEGLKYVGSLVGRVWPAG